MNPKIFLDMAKNLTGKGTDSAIELPTPQGWYDRLLNAINRLGRPLLLVSVVIFFIWGVIDPTHFVTVMKAYSETPEFVSTAILIIISLFGSGRIIQDVKKRQTMKVPPVEAPPTPVAKPEGKLSDRRFDNLEDEDDDDLEDLPEENEAIEKWKSENSKSA